MQDGEKGYKKGGFSSVLTDFSHLLPSRLMDIKTKIPSAAHQEDNHIALDSRADAHRKREGPGEQGAHDK